MIPLNSCHPTVTYLLYMFLRNDGLPYSVRYLDPEADLVIGHFGLMSGPRFDVVQCNRPRPVLLALDSYKVRCIIVSPSIPDVVPGNYGALRNIYLWAHLGRQINKSKERLDGCSS